MSSLPGGVITFLFTDIEGSVRLWEDYPHEMTQALPRHQQIIEDAVTQNGGRFVRTRGEGDSTFSVFTFPLAALQAVCEFQASLSAEAWPGDLHLCVRAALHTGAAEPVGDDYTNSAVNRCARLRAIAHGGQTIASEALYALVRDDLPRDIELQDLGLHRLRDLQRPERVFQVIGPGGATEFPPLLSLDRVATNLPEHRTSFIGREDEQQAIEVLLSQSRLVTVAGGGGVGKTRLSLQVAADRLDLFPDGAWLVDLSVVADPAGVRTAIAAVLGLREEPGRDPDQRLMQFLSIRKALLILDNCEHLVEACAEFADRLLEQAPRIRLLATSREPLGVPGERVYRLLPLPLPGAGESPAAAPTGALQFFLERATVWRPSIRSDEAILPPALEICRRLDGIPLALELAAAMVRVLDVDEIARRLDDRFTLLSTSSRTVQPRQQTLQAAIDWSYDLLSPPEKTLLGRLSIFEGGWTLHGAEAICADGADIGAADILPLLVRLVDRSLVTEVTHGAGRRYRLLETLKSYAAQRRMQHAAVQDALQNHHAQYYLELAQDGASQMRTPAEAAALQRMSNDLDNLRAALRQLRQTGPPHSIIRLATSLYEYLYRRGLWDEARQSLEIAEEQLPHAERESVIDQSPIDQSADDQSPIDHIAALLHRQLAVLAMERGDQTQARIRLETSLALCANDDRGAVETMNLLALRSLDTGQNDEARRWLDAAITRNPAGELRGRVLHNLGLLSARQDKLEDARGFYMEALGERLRFGDRRGEAETLGGLGSLAHRADDRAEARRVYRESLALRRALDDRFGAAVILNNLGDLAERDDDIDSAVVFYLQSRDIFREMQAAAVRAPEEELEKICPTLDPLRLQDLERRAAAEDPFRSEVAS